MSREMLQLLREKPRTVEELAQKLNKSKPHVKWKLLDLPVKCEKTNNHIKVYFDNSQICPFYFSSALSSNHYSVEQLSEICSLCDKPETECRSCELYNSYIKNFEGDVRIPLGDVRVKDRAYINEEPKDVRSPDKTKNSNYKKKSSHKLLDKHNNISESHVRTSGGTKPSSKKACKQAHLSSYQLNEVDVQILDLLSKNHYPAQIGRMIGLDRRRVSEKVNKLFKMELITPKTSYPK